MKAPCYGCEERHYLCHSECKHYKAYARILEARHRAKEQEIRTKAYDIDKWHRLWDIKNKKSKQKYKKR